MPYNRLKNLSEEKRSLIIETALNEFLISDFNTASINQISKKAGLSAGALYYYFEDKEDLFYTTLEFVMIRLMDKIGDIEDYFSNHEYWESIESFVYKRLDFSLAHPKYMKLFNRIINSNDPVESKGKEQLLKPFHYIFTFGYEHGYIRTDLPKDLVFEVHLNMMLAVNKWSFEQQLSNEEAIFDLKAVSKKSIGMIQSAIGKNNN